SSRRRHTRFSRDWSSDVCSSDLNMVERSILFAKDEVIKEMSFTELFKTETSTVENEFYTKTLQEVEKEHILKVVKKCSGRISGRSEERRVGKECRSRWSTKQKKK